MKTDVAIVGGGPAGTATALFLAQLGIQSTLIERDIFPRFHIGESLTGECGNMLRALGLADEMSQAQHPIKYGVKVFGPSGRAAFRVPVMRRSAEGELQESFTWQVRRSVFDQMLLDHTLDQGTTFVQGKALGPLWADDGSVKGVCVKTSAGSVQTIGAAVVVDASGPTAFLSHSGVTSKMERGNYTNQVAIFSHVTGAIRDKDKDRDNTLIFYQQKNHWAWFIPIDEATVSVGVVVPAAYFAAKGESRHDFYLREIQTLNPELADRVAGATLVEEVRAISNYSYHIKNFTGKGFLCVGDSHRFVDPIFSFGLHFAMAEARMAAEAIVASLDSKSGGNGTITNPFAAYQRRCERGQDVIQTLIDTFWQHPLAFAYMAHVQFADEITDVFAGRVYDETPTHGMLAMRKLLATPKKQISHSV